MKNKLHLHLSDEIIWQLWRQPLFGGSAETMWTLHEGEKAWVATFIFLNLSCSSACNKKWYDCFDMVPMVSEEGQIPSWVRIKVGVWCKPEVELRWALLTRTVMLSAKIWSIWNWVPSLSPNQHMKLYTFTESVQKIPIYCHYYLNFHNPKLGASRFIPESS